MPDMNLFSRDRFLLIGIRSCKFGMTRKPNATEAPIGLVVTLMWLTVPALALASMTLKSFVGVKRTML